MNAAEQVGVVTGASSGLAQAAVRAWRAAPFVTGTILPIDGGMATGRW
jgi:NADP-dependent 3-hydroxy acid dehydrogenase YdfG